MLSFLTPKIGAALALALVASSGFAWLQTERLAAANIKVTSLTTEADMLAQLAKSYKSTADAKDGVIKQQTEGLDAILKRSEEHTSELQSLMRISYAVFCLKKKKKKQTKTH